jgi:hypothetical protein
MKPGNPAGLTAVRMHGINIRVIIDRLSKRTQNNPISVIAASASGFAPVPDNLAESDGQPAGAVFADVA